MIARSSCYENIHVLKSLVFLLIGRVRLDGLTTPTPKSDMLEGNISHCPLP